MAWSRALDPRLITPFVRDVVLPCIEDQEPRLSPLCSHFALELRNSTIHRWGVFAAEAIPTRRKVIEYTGQWISHSEARRRLPRPRSYLFRFDDEWVVDGAIGGNGSQYINHCCEPNLRVTRLGRHILFFARRRIDAGEELTIDYEFSPDAARVDCCCGAPRCRGTINRY